LCWGKFEAAIRFITAKPTARSNHSSTN